MISARQNFMGLTVKALREELTRADIPFKASDRKPRLVTLMCRWHRSWTIQEAYAFQRYGQHYYPYPSYTPRQNRRIRKAVNRALKMRKDT